MNLSVSLDNIILILGLLFNDLTFRAIAKAKSFSVVPSVAIPPRSSPP
jgi:hypothetical protein